MISGLSSRRSLARLRAEGEKAGRGPLRLQFRPSDDPSPRVAFAIPRQVGGAVVRNRIRRRIRAVLQDLDRETDDLPPPGDLLVRVTGPLDHWSYEQLREEMTLLLRPWARP